jgi:hypothetical protein
LWPRLSFALSNPQMFRFPQLLGCHRRHALPLRLSILKRSARM